jgi:NAD(P)-dependent dehydrogenase (short-subunit alcohol dehydrogenase family)
MACRESEKAKKALEEVRDRHSSNKDSIVLEFIDLSDLSTVKNFVNRLIEKNIKLDVLINNAGIIINDRKVTKDGFEMQVK